MGGDVSATIRAMVHKLIETTARAELHRRGQFRLECGRREGVSGKALSKPGTLRPVRRADQEDGRAGRAGQVAGKGRGRFLRRAGGAFRAEIGIDMREFERVVLLSVIDRHWMDHIDDMDNLRDGIGLRAYGQQNPVQEYRRESYDMLNEMIRSPSGRRRYAAFTRAGSSVCRSGRRPSIWKRRRPVYRARTRTGRRRRGGAPVSKSQRGAGRPAARPVRPGGSGKEQQHCCGKGRQSLRSTTRQPFGRGAARGTRGPAGKATAARRRASRLAGRGSAPGTPDCAPMARQGAQACGLAGSYRRSATGLAVRGSGVISCRVGGYRSPFGGWASWLAQGARLGFIPWPQGRMLCVSVGQPILTNECLFHSTVSDKEPKNNGDD